jgi:hypothetical protein
VRSGYRGAQEYRYPRRGIAAALDDGAAPRGDGFSRTRNANRRDGAMEQIEMFAGEFVESSDEEHAVNAWRTEQLRRLGFSSALADVCAGLVDWHEIADLIKRGCSPQLALDIVR